MMVLDGVVSYVVDSCSMARLSTSLRRNLVLGVCMKVWFCFLATLLFGVAAFAQNIQGDWEAQIIERGVPSAYVLHIAPQTNAVSGKVDVPERFEFGTAVDSISIQDSALRFRFGQISYEGVLATDSQSIEGIASVGGDKQKAIWRRAAPESNLESVAVRLKSLMYLPAEKWKTHVGDIPHGEALDIDDNSWNLTGPDGSGSYEATWYRRWIEVPKVLNGYDLTGTKIWFQFQADANGPLPEIIYFNGRRVAMGDDLEPIILFDSAKPGDKVLIAVKLLATVDRKHFTGTELRIDFASGRPNPAYLFDEMGTVSTLASYTGASAQYVRQGLAKSATAVDLRALDRSDQQGFDTSLVAARALLEPLKPYLQQTSVRLTGNSHIDAAWLWPWSETVDVTRRTFATALQLMDEYPQYTYTQSAAAYSDWIVEKYPFMYSQIRDRVKQGRWEMVGGMWVEPDLNMPDGESLVRQLLIGKRYFKEKFGSDVRIGWNPDSFGYNWQLPQIYKKSGIDYFVTQKMAWNDFNQLPLKVFWWQSPDGSRVLTYFPHDYVNEIQPLRIASDVATSDALNPGVPEMMHLFGVGDHGGGPTRAMLDNGVHWSSPDVIFPKTRFGIAQEFFSDIEARADTAHAPVWNYKSLADGVAPLPAPSQGGFSLPIWNDELYLEYHRGVFTTQADHKRNMRESEEAVLNAEKVSSLAWLWGTPYPATQLTEAWKKVLFNQFHDLAAGSGIGVIYKDAQRDYDFVRLQIDQISSQALHAIASHIRTKSPADEIPILVTNPLAWERTDLVKVSVQMPGSLNDISVVNGQGVQQLVQVLSKDEKLNRYELLVEANDVPSIGYRVFRVVPRASSLHSDLKVDGFTLENSTLRVSVDPESGCIASVYDKNSKFEFIEAGGCGNELIAFKDTPKDFDAWNIDADFEQHFTKLDKADSVQVIEKGPLRATVRVTRTWQNSKFVQDISLYAGLSRIDISNDIDWHETHVLLKAAFPLAASTAQATYEIPYGAIDRPTTQNNRFEAAKFEVPALRWADLGDGRHGFSLINESKYGYDAKDNVLRLSLLRSPTWPDSEADRGHHHFSYSLYPHDGDWKRALTVRRGFEFNYKLSAMQVDSHEGSLTDAHSFVGLKQENVVLTAIKKTEDGDGILLRFYEWAGKAGEVQVSVPVGATDATLTNLMEQPEGAPLALNAASQITVPVHPFEIVSVRVNYPAKREH
jgi:alpha-mannosidase